MRSDIEITDEVIEAGPDAITEFYDPWEEKLPKDMFPAAIRSILVAVSRVVRKRHPELPHFVVSEDASVRYLSWSQLGIGGLRSEILQAVHLPRGAVCQERHRRRDDIEPDSTGAR
ncbi:hypothetical protein [Rhizobium anhuiense]|uniref:hypothetical protein n=1 Tax=Rhizobium anhuiense TaxID=1184720 RepID=UPI0010D9532D|nr:hypothetical protein [Rhizobium anhuiense]